jgi:hypothetical protein
MKNTIKELNHHLNQQYNELLNYYNLIEPQEVQDYLKFIYNFDKLGKILDESVLDEKIFKNNVLSYLLIRNLTKYQKFNDPLEEKILTLKLITSLDNNKQDDILKTYIISGLYFIKENYDYYFLNFKKSLINYFHDLGGFEIKTWGIGLNLVMFKSLINSKDLKKFLNYSKNVRWEQLSMLNYL